MKHEKWESETSRGLITSFIFAAILLFAGSYFYLRNEKTIWSNQALKQLKNTSILKSSQVESWRQERLGDVREIAQSPLLQDAVLNLIDHRDKKELEREIQLRLQVVIRNNPNCINILITDTTSQVILAGKTGDTEFVDKSTIKSVREVIKAKTEIIGDLFKREKDGAIYIDIACPIVNNQREVHAIILFRIDPNVQLNSIVKAGTIDSTEEAFLFEKAGDSVLYLTNLKYFPNAALSLKFPLTKDDNPAVRAVKNGPGYYLGIGYHGQKVVEYIRPIKNSSWFLASKINSDELYKPVYQRIKIISIILTLLFLSFSAVVFLIINYRRKHFFKQLLEDELKQAALKSHYEYVVKYANDIILLEDENLNIIDANQRAQQAYQYSLEELQKLKQTNLVAPDFRKYAASLLKDLAEDEGYIVESVHQRKDGSQFNVEISARIIQVDSRNFLHQVIRDITERKQTEAALRESEERFRTTLYSTGDAIITTDLNGNICYLNPVAESLTGWTETEASGKPIRQVFCVFSEDTLEEVENPVDKVLEKGMIVMLSNHTFLRSKNGDEIPIGDSGAPIRGAEGKITGVVLVFRDQTHEREAQRKIKESEEKYRKAFQTSPDAVNINQLDGLYVEINEGFTNLSGFTRDEAIGKRSSEINIWAIPEDREKLIAGLKENGFVHNLESRFRCKDGSLKTALMSANLITLNNQPHILSITRDITEFKINANVLRERESFLNNLLAVMPVPVFYKDKDGKYLDANNSFVSLFGYSRELLIGKTVFDLYPPDLAEIYFEKDREILDSGGTQVYESRFIDAIGFEHDVIIHKATYQNVQNEISGLIGIIIDITERKQAEAEQFRLLNIIENSLNEIYVFDAITLKFEFVNHGALENLGFSLEEIKELTPVDIKPEFTDETFRQVLEPLTTGEKDQLVIKTIHRRKNGISYPVEIHLQLHKAENKSVFLAVTNDITEQLESLRARRESEERFKNIFNISPDAISISEIQTGRYLEVNESFEKFSGFKREEIIGKSSVELGFWVDKWDRELFINSLKLKGYVDNSEVAFRVKDGRLIQTLISARIVEFADQSYLLSVTKDITERINAEIEVRQSELKFKSLFENAADPILLVDFNGNILDVNPAACNILGYSGNELRNMKTIDLNTEKYKPKVKDRLENLAREGYLYFETAHQAKDGSVLLFEIHSKVIEIDGKENILSVYRDITLRKQAADALRKSEENFRNYFENSPLGKLVTGIDGSLKVNQAFCQMLGYSKEELLKLKWKEITHKNDIRLSEKNMKSLVDGVKEIVWFEKRYIHKNGNVVYTEISATLQRDTEGKPSYFISTIQDITERKRAQKQLRLLGRAIDQNPVAIVITNTDGVIEYVNPKFTEVTGYASAEVIGRNPSILQSGEHSPEFYRGLWDTILSGNDWHGEFHNKKKNGEHYWESAVISPVFDESGKISSFVAVKEDITEKKKIIHDLIIAKENAQESDRLKSAFLSTMSHELRTPLNAVIGFSSLIDEETPMDQITMYSQMILKSGNNLLDIIEGILDLTLLESGESKTHYERFSLLPFMKNLITLAKDEQKKANKPQIEIECLSCNSDHHIQLYSDQQMINRIFAHLFQNAFKFTSSGKVEFGYMVGSNGESDRIRFFVKDTGIGVPENQKAIIFDKFRQADDSHTRKYGGTGIGLTIVKHKVELLGGQILLDSTSGEGSTFYFTIPILEPKLVIRKSLEYNGEMKAQNNFSNQTILIAEDEDSNFQLFTYLLIKSNLRILHARDGFEAINLFKAHPEIKLVLMDINMPNMNGYEATKKIKASKPEIPVIAVTAFAMSGDRETSLSQGCDEHLEKPIRKEQLFTLLQKFIS